MKLNCKKKLIGIVMVSLCIGLLSVPSVSALEDNTRKYIINEFDGINNKLNEMQNSKLRSSDSTKLDDLKKLKNEYVNYIYELKELSKEELENKNFNNTQIAAIKKFDGSDKLASRASAYVKATNKITSHSYFKSSNKTTVSASFSGSWVGTPYIQSQDTVGIGIVGTNSLFSRISSSHSVTYNNGKTVTGNRKYYPMSGDTYKFGICSGTYGDVFKKFNMTYKADATGKISIVEATFVYAHAELQLSGFGLGFSYSNAGVTPSLSFSINKGFSEEYSDVKRSDI